MGNQPVKYKYKKLFDPQKFDLEGCIKYYQFIEKNFPLGDMEYQIKKCSNYFLNTTHIVNLEKYMHEGAYILAMIREIKKEEPIKNNEEELEYYDKLYKEIYDILIAVA